MIVKKRTEQMIHGLTGASIVETCIFNSSQTQLQRYEAQRSSSAKRTS